jgi:hypothetical protein
MVLMSRSRFVRWTFGRDLIRSGLLEPSGDGDVHVWPCVDCDGHGAVVIELCSGNVCALFQARSEDLSGFVEQMDKAVEPGAESRHVSVDAATAAILVADAASLC